MLRVYVETSVFSAAARGQFAAEAAAYDEIKALAGRGALELVSSPITLEEFAKIPAKYPVAPHHAQYDAVGTVWSDETFEEWNPATEVNDEEDDPTLEALRVVVPDENDARHLAQAALSSMDVLLTLDEKTILKFAAAIRVHAGLEVLRPSELMAWCSRGDEEPPE